MLLPRDMYSGDRWRGRLGNVDENTSSAASSISVSWCRLYEEVTEYPEEVKIPSN